MMIRNKFLFFGILFLLVSSFSIRASSYTIEDFHSHIEISSTGYYDIVERISINFREPRHGFYRVLPIIYEFDDPTVENIRVRVSNIRANDDIQTSRSGDYLTIRVGSADRRVSGLKEYRLSYRYDIGSDRNVGYDEFYFNIVGESWEVPIERYSFSIVFPSPIEKERISFTRGVWGTLTSEGVTWTLSSDRKTIEGAVSRLLPGEAVTVRVEMNEGYFAKRTDWQSIFRILFSFLSPLTVLLAFWIWQKYGRDKELVIFPRFEVPHNMTPMDVGYIIDETLDPRDVTSMIFYWADKGALTIVEEGKKFSFIQGETISFSSKHEKQLYDAFFACGKGGVVKSSDLEGKFFQAYQKLIKTVSLHYRGERALASTKSRNMAALVGLFLFIPSCGFSLSLTANYLSGATVVLFVLSLFSGIILALISHVMMRIWHMRKVGNRMVWKISYLLVSLFLFNILSLASFFVGEQLSTGLWAAGIALVSIAPIAFFAIITKQRSEYAREKIEEIVGFKDFIEKVEIEKLKKMIADDPLYYYHVLSFAIVLGLEKKWAKKFDSITLEPPSWYVGSYGVWNAVYLSSMLSRCNSSLLTSVATSPKTAGSPGSRFGGSSFGGGGFSGGGFGGGGGGAW